MTAARPAGVDRPPVASQRRQGWEQGDVAVLVIWIAFLALLNVWGKDLAETTEIGLGEPPLHGNWDVRINTGTLLALAVGATFALLGPKVAQGLPWRWVVVAVVGSATVWGLALASNDGIAGWTRGMAPETDYVRVADEIDDPARFLENFAAEIHDGSHPTHVAGHPPGFVLVLWALRSVGFSGTGWATALVIAGGSAALGVIAMTVRAVATEAAARAAAPFLALSPAAVRMVTTPDAFFALAGAIGIGALCAAAYRRGRRADVLAFVGGVGMASALLFSYGLALLVITPLIVCWRRRVCRPLVIGGATAAVILLAFHPLGFWWLDGLDATRERYWSGFAATRPFSYFLFANVGALTLTLGPATAMALRRIRSSPVADLVGGALLAMLLANLSGMSKGEVERIWLPFALWVLPIGAVFASRIRWAQSALALQVAAAIALQATVHSS